MTRVFMNKPAAAPDGSFSVSWFGPGKAVATSIRESVQFPDSGTYPDAGPVHPQRLYRTPAGRRAPEAGASKSGCITPHQAREWLIPTGEPGENIARWPGPAGEERGPGRPKAGDQACFTVPAAGPLTSGTGAPGRRARRTPAGPAHPPAGSRGRAARISPSSRRSSCALLPRRSRRAGVCSPARPPRHPGGLKRPPVTPRLGCARQAWREEVTKNMTGSKKRRRRGEIERPGAGHREHADQTGTAVRLVMMTWEIVRALVRGHVLRGTGPGRLP